MLLSKDSKKSSKGKGKKRTKKTSQSQSNKKEMTKSASSNANMNNLKPVSFFWNTYNKGSHNTEEDFMIVLFKPLEVQPSG